MKKILLISALILGVSSSAYAVPSLGVATNYGYVGESGQTTLEDYQDYFVDMFYPGEDATHGFVVGPSGSDLIVFSDIVGTEIFLLTTADVFLDNGPVTLDGQPLVSLYSGQHITGEYKPVPNYGISLGTVSGADWAALPNSGPDDFPGSQQFYVNYVTLTYTGSIDPSAYFFAVADTDGSGGPNKGDAFSPPTSSSSGAPVPEPTTMLLLGTGLAGLAGAVRRKRTQK